MHEQSPHARLCRTGLALAHEHTSWRSMPAHAPKSPPRPSRAPCAHLHSANGHVHLHLEGDDLDDARGLTAKAGSVPGE